MKNYEKPYLEDSSMVLEGVYAASGSINNPPPQDPPKEEPKREWNIGCKFGNHNSGSHSEVAIFGHNYGNHSGEGIKMNFLCCGLKLDYIKDCGGYEFSNVSETGFTCFRRGHFNPNENFEFNIQIVVKDSPYHGAYGKTGEYCACPIQCLSYTTC